MADKKKKTKQGKAKAAGDGGRKAKAGASKPRQRKSDAAGFDIAKLLEHPLVTDLLAVGAMAAVAAIAEQKVQSRSGDSAAQSKGAVKAAGKAAAAAIGRRLMSEVKEVRKAAKPAKG